jgi:hypothetical protein
MALLKMFYMPREKVLKGLDSNNWNNVLNNQAKTTRWALCVGAGISRGVFPDWSTLVYELIKKDPEVDSSCRLLARLRKAFSLDALVQAAQNRLCLEDEEFIFLLRDCLYQTIKTKSGDKWPLIAKGLTAVSPAQLTRKEWDEYSNLIGALNSQSSALVIAKIIYKIANTSIAPDSIITLNAETLLYSLINCEIAKNSKPDESLADKRIVDRVTKGISSRDANRIPYFYCHGLLPVEGGLPPFDKVISTNYLVFSEGEYLQVANSAFTWQSATFLGIASQRSMVFIGLSLSDPNIRKWLGWIHDSHDEEFAEKKKPNEKYGHYWITTRPKPRSESLERWMECAVRHLGVRVVWLDSWGELDKCLRQMLAINCTSKMAI